MEYKVVADKIEVRSMKKGDKPRYIVNGTAIVANKKHMFDYKKQRDGSIKTLKNLFTSHFLESMREQAKHKSVFVDTQHQLVRDASMKAVMKGKLSDEEMKQIDTMMKRKMLPLAKINDIDIDGNSLKIYTECNPMFREVDEDHKKYFDAVWYSLENKFLNGISINLANFKYLKDSNDDLVIDDADLVGFSYVDSPAGHDHSIDEVAIRAIGDGITGTGETKMEDAQKKLEEDQKKLETDRKTLEDEKAAILKGKQDAAEALKIKTAEETKATEVQKQKDDQAKIEKELAETAEKLKKTEAEKTKLEANLNKAKGVVGKKDNPNASAKGAEHNDKFYEENLKKITEDHDKAIETVSGGKTPSVDTSMKGFSELVNLQAKANSPTAGLNERDADYAQEHKLMGKGPADLIMPKPN